MEKKLNKKIITKFAYVTSGVVYDVKFESGDSVDACCIQITSGNTPYISVKKVEDEDFTKLYFDEYIAKGDEYVSGDTATFRHRVHAETHDEEQVISFQDFYKQLCEEQIAESIMYYYNKPYSAFTNETLGVNAYMLNGSGYTVEGIDQIDFTEEYFNDVKENEVQKKVYKSAYDTASKYGYNLITPSGSTDIEIVLK